MQSHNQLRLFLIERYLLKTIQGVRLSNTLVVTIRN